MKATDFLVDKVAEVVAKVIAPDITRVKNSSSMTHIDKELSRANDIMQTMTNHQVMMMALPEIKDRYFSVVLI